MRNKLFYQTVLLLFILLISTLSWADSVKVKYSETTDIFNFIDHLSLWDNELPPKYYDFWKSQYWEPNDGTILKQYAKVRVKYSKNEPSTILPHGKKEDPLAEVFYYADNFDDAFAKLKKDIEPDDLAIIKRTISHFSPKIKKIIRAHKEPSHIIEYFEGFLKEKHVIEYINKICTFYSVDPKNINATVFVVWWPDQKYDLALSIDKSIFIYSALDNVDKEVLNHKKVLFSSVILHELTHHISKLRTSSCKNTLATTVNSCVKELNIPSQKYLYLMEEPLAVILGQMLYIEKFHPEHYNYTEDWYANPLINALARLGKPLVNEYLSQNKPMDNEFIKLYFALVMEMMAASDVAMSKV